MSDNLREVIARVVGMYQSAALPVTSRGLAHDLEVADALLALPEVADLLGDAERVRRVRELHKGVCNWDTPECEACSWFDDDGCHYYAPSPCPTLRALDAGPS